MTSRRSVGEAFFLPSQSGQLFAIYYPPIDPLVNRLDVLLVPPFAEEMNKSRRMFAMLAEQLAASGIGVLSIDLFGTGDSQGDFNDARWATWLSDIDCAMAFLRQRSAQRIAVLGLRAGALLALEFQRREPSCFRAILLWQPVLNGATYMNQFLRLRVAADRLENRPQATTTSMLRTLLAEGQTLEIGGYELHPALFESLSLCNVEAPDNAVTIPIHWFDVSSQEPGLAPSASTRIMQAWREAGADVMFHSVPGQSFWDAQETTTVPALCDQTVSVLRSL